ncbi:peptide ABC transporter substrate-binding protein [Aerococcus kribbianus]|uniref:Peptide ABC transporter substrate-binding protein n=1 Tax=Aerococcus kribbianus TaxID=2999064 RepID=A0A9X3JG80_9LACT|nr:MULTISPECIES: peptide ABC transporter substrate-binding protein [unclassified Aerococcus]MCZ0716961.1 peptide ABC transporter substrate-binding protein [Aerococcus sp. YH-aer221]MCZ0725249.1 peptide ABC transporter substrate-binding protein [Aerococcus sp. YH-aer222]
MRKSKMIIGLATTLLLAACSGNSSGDSGSSNGNSSEGAVVNYVAPTEIATLDSSLVTDMNSANYLGHIQEGLYWENEENEVQPALAKDMPQVSEDGLTYTIKLRKDAKWSNGDPITAHDFVYAIQRLADPNTGAPYSYLLENFANAKAVLAGEADVDTLGVRALDDYTVEIKLDQATPYMLNLLAFPVLYPLNQDFVEEKGDAYGTSADNLLFSGPFVLENWDGTGLEWTLVKNPDYYNADDIKIDQVNVQVLKEISTNTNLYEAGEVDNSLLTGETVKQFMDHPDAVQQAKARNYWLAFNFENDSLQNDSLRKAIDYVIDNEQLASDVIGDGSQPVATFVPKNFIFNPENNTEFTEEMGLRDRFDLAEAEKYWDQAKEELGTKEVSLKLIGDDDEKSKNTTQYIQGQLQNNLPGLKVDIVSVPKKNRLDAEEKGDYDLALTGWAADFADGINFYELYQTDAPYNRAHYSNDAYDAEIEAAKGENANDAMARWNNFKQAQSILTDDTAMVPLYQEVETQLRNPRLVNITFRPVGNEFDLRTAEIAEN